MSSQTIAELSLEHCEVAESRGLTPVRKSMEAGLALALAESTCGLLNDPSDVESQQDDATWPSRVVASHSRSVYKKGIAGVLRRHWWKPKTLVLHKTVKQPPVAGSVGDGVVVPGRLTYYDQRSVSRACLPNLAGAPKRTVGLAGARAVFAEVPPRSRNMLSRPVGAGRGGVELRLEGGEVFEFCFQYPSVARAWVLLLNQEAATMATGEIELLPGHAVAPSPPPAAAVPEAPLELPAAETAAESAAFRSELPARRVGRVGPVGPANGLAAMVELRVSLVLLGHFLVASSMAWRWLQSPRFTSAVVWAWNVVPRWSHALGNHVLAGDVRPRGDERGGLPQLLNTPKQWAAKAIWHTAPAYVNEEMNPHVVYCTSFCYENVVLG